MKYDEDKIRPSLIITDMNHALDQVIRVAEFGAKKYGEQSWLTLENGYQRYTDAMLRHLLSQSRTMYDSDSGMMHDAHIAWNALARLELKVRDAVLNRQWLYDKDVEKDGRWEV